VCASWKAFNTTFAGPLTQGEVAGQPLDGLIAGDDDEAQSEVAALARDGRLKPITSARKRAHVSSRPRACFTWSSGHARHEL
jgi:hypothetical protein